MTTQADQINTLIGRADTLLDKQENFEADAAQVIDDQVSRVDDFISGATHELVTPRVLRYEPVIHSKQTLNIVADPEDDTRSLWMIVPNKITDNSHIYDYHGKKATVELSRSYSAPPGYYEDPQYGTDQSISRMQFVIANTSATPQEINQVLDELDIEPDQISQWGGSVMTHPINSVHISNRFPNSSLFVRFINIAHSSAPAGSVAQEITAFGGNPIFVVNNIKSYNLEN